MLKNLPFVALSSLIFLSACSDSSSDQQPKGNTVSVMTYNVENLFDTLHDEGKNDFTYLPLSSKKGNAEAEAICQAQDSEFRIKECLETDWSDSTLQTKMYRLAETVFSHRASGPDILMLQEVENLNVLQQWNRHYLRSAGYLTEVLIEGEDERGIDVGLLSRLPLAGAPMLHKIQFSAGIKESNGEPVRTRGILEVPLQLPSGETVYVFGFHFPSQSNPMIMRKEAIQFLNQLVQSKGPKAYVIAGGDSNVSAKEESVHQLQTGLMSTQLKAAHQLGCSGCKGTEYYRGVWSMFDVLLFSPTLISANAGSYRVLPESISILKKGRYQLGPDGTPKHFDAKSPYGVADHLPVYAEIEIPATPAK